MTRGWTTLLGLALFTSVATGSRDGDFGPDFQRNTSRHQAAVRAHVTSQPDYDIDIPPISKRARTAGEAGHYSDAGTDVFLNVRFFKVEYVAPAEAAMPGLEKTLPFSTFSAKFLVTGT